MSNGYGKHGGQHRQFGGPGRPQGGGPADRHADGGRGDGGGIADNPIARALEGTATIKLWDDVAPKRPRPELLDQEARERAQTLKDVPTAQLRRFYGAVIAFKQRLQIDNNVSDGEVRAQLAYTKASAAYAGMRMKRRELVDFLVAAANSVNTRDDFNAFARHFEAVVAYHKVFAKSEN